MKTSLLLLSLLFLAPLISFGQGDYDFQRDENYLAYQREADRLLEQKVNYAMLEQIMRDEKVDENEYEIMHTAFGFKSMSSFEAYLNTQLGRIQMLEKRYKVSSQDLDPNPTAESSTTTSKYNHAQCLENARLVAIAGHVACIPYDLSALIGGFGAGAACHAAVEAIRALMIHTCNVKLAQQQGANERDAGLEAIKNERKKG
jgi:hypothetical protein